MGNGSGVAFIHSTAGRYTATACATSASSSTWPIPCHRLSLSNSTLPPLISMLTVSLCHTIFLPALHTTLSKPLSLSHQNRMCVYYSYGLFPARAFGFLSSVALSVRGFVLSFFFKWQLSLPSLLPW